MIKDDIIYNLIDKFKLYQRKIREQDIDIIVYPCVLNVIVVINHDPLILGVNVIDGILKKGVPLILFNESRLNIGVVESIQHNKKDLEKAKINNGDIAIKIKTEIKHKNIEKNMKLVSKINRESIDILKDYHRNELNKNDWDLVRKLKLFFSIK